MNRFLLVLGGCITIVLIIISIWAMRPEKTPFSTSPDPSPVATPTPENPVPAAGDITTQGRVVCLPHRDKSGPTTLECAYGLEDGEGRYYQLTSDSQGALQEINSLPVGSVVEVGGTFTPSSAGIYDTIGSIALTDLSVISSNPL